MPKRNYNIFDWKEQEKKSDRLGDVDHQAHIQVLAFAESHDGGGKYLLEITDEKNLDQSALFEVIIDGGGRIANFQACPDIRIYPAITIEASQYTKGVKALVVSVMGNDLGETMYIIHLNHRRYVRNAVEFEVTVYPTEQMSYIQEPSHHPLLLADEDSG